MPTAVKDRIAGPAGCEANRYGGKDVDFGKMQIVNLLAAYHGHTSLLEISTGTTGHKFNEVDRSIFSKAERLAYNLQGAEDSQPVRYRSETLDIGDCVAEIERCGATYDCVFVDPFHDHACSARDLELAYNILNPDGTIVVHDCLPPIGGALISPAFVEGAWCGVTFIAYVDFLMKIRPEFRMIDCDYGCGVIRKGGPPKNFQLDTFEDGWKGARQEPENALNFISVHKRELLNLETPYEFLKQHFRLAAVACRGLL